MKPRVLFFFAMLLAIFAALSFACRPGGNVHHRYTPTDDDASPADDDATPADDDDDSATQSFWTDTTSGLTWQTGSAVGLNNYDWADAKSFCTGVKWDGMTGWRLPTIAELRTLVRECPATGTGGTCGVTYGCLQSSCLDSTCGGCDSGGGPGPVGEYLPPQITGPSGWYWSSSIVTDLSDQAWIIQYDGATINIGLLGSQNVVRCVK
jgi:hypothetical protein